jgi:glycosyltransferase involved in cell wall biosynthesis
MVLSNPFMVDPRVYKEAKSLVDAGHEVVVIVWDRKHEYQPEECVDDIRIVRVYNSRLMKVFPHDLFRNPFWWWHAFRKGVSLFKTGFEFNVVHCHDLDTLVAGVLLKKTLGVNLVYDAHEIFGYMISWDVPKIVTRFVFIMEKILTQHVDHIITVTEPVIDYFKTITDKPISLVMNCKDLAIQEYQKPTSAVFTLAYIGVIHKRRFFPELVDTIGKLENVRLLLAVKQENMSLYEIVRRKAEGFDNIDFLGTIPHNKVIPTTLQSHAVICIIDDSHPSTKVGIATKLFDAMACGRPIIVSEIIHTADLVKQHNCGLVVPYDSEAISKAVLQLKDDALLCTKLGRNGLDAAKKFYNWDVQKERLLEVYKTMDD